MRDPEVLLMGAIGMQAGMHGSDIPQLPPDIVSGSGSPQPTPKSSSSSGWPAAAVPRADAWVIDPNGYAKYRIQKGDTLSGLAKTYLGMYERVKEWISINPDRNPDSIPVGALINAPPDAIANAKQRGFLPWTVSSKTGKSNAKKFLFGGLAVGTVAIGGTALAVHLHHKHALG